MTKEEFIRQATVIADYIEVQRKVNKFINETLTSELTHLDFGEDLVDLAIEQLSIISGLNENSIQLYLYDGGGRCVHEDGFEINVKNLSDLWDFEMHVKECCKSEK